MMLGDPTRGLRIVGAPDGPRISKKQQRFNKLVKEAARLKEAVRAWSQALPEIHRGIAEHERLLTGYRAVIAELVRLFDQAYPHRSLTKRERAYLRRILCDTARELLEGRADDSEELKEIYNRHSQRDFDAEVAGEDAAQARMMRAMLEQQFGFDFGGAEIRSVGELEEATLSQIDELSREAERPSRAAERQARRKKSARQAAAEVRRETERVQVGKALQEVYRKLAIALHPDREPDPEERARKTLLMQQINVAYEAKDLLQLLELQLRFEQIDEGQISGLADERLDRYNLLLAEQVGQLKEELAGIEMPWRMQLGPPPPREAVARARPGAPAGGPARGRRPDRAGEARSGAALRSAQAQGVAAGIDGRGARPARVRRPVRRRLTSPPLEDSGVSPAARRTAAPGRASPGGELHDALGHVVVLPPAGRQAAVPLHARGATG